jgi:ankyrin repeat protein
LKRPKIVKEALRTLPKTLDETYERILLQLSSKAEDNLILLKRILVFVTFGKRPMTVAELAQAVVIEIRGKKFDDDAAFHNPEDLLSLCNPLIVASPSTGLLGFVHYSIQEFLLSERLSNAKGMIRTFALDAKSCHTEIAQLCLSFVNFEDFSDRPCQTYKEIQDRKEKYPFLEYAATSWPYHTQYEDVERRVSDCMLRLFIPQKNPRLASMLQACDNPSIYLSADGDDFLEFSTFPARDEPIIRKRNMNSLANAAFFGLNSVLKEIVESGADIDAPGTRWGNALQNAVFGGHMEVVRNLLNLGADINFPGCGGYGTALMTAICWGKQEIIDFLFELNADVTITGGAYHTALHTAAFMDDVPTMERIIQRGADIDFGKDSWKPYSLSFPLGMAVSYGSSRAALFLIASGASLCNIPVSEWANKLAIGRYEAPTKELALIFVEELSHLGHYVEVVDNLEEEASLEEEDRGRRLPFTF